MDNLRRESSSSLSIINYQLSILSQKSSCGNNSIHLLIMRFHGNSREELAFQSDAVHLRSRMSFPLLRDPLVVASIAASQTMTVRGKCPCGDECVFEGGRIEEGEPFLKVRGCGERRAAGSEDRGRAGRRNSCGRSGEVELCSASQQLFEERAHIRFVFQWKIGGYRKSIALREDFYDFPAEGSALGVPLALRVGRETLTDGVAQFRFFIARIHGAIIMKTLERSTKS